MKLLDYIKGQRKGKDAQRIEKDSMTDPFLYEAIEGFDSVNDNHIDRINNIQKRFKAKTNTTRYNRTWQTAAASVIAIAALGGYFLTDYHKSGLHAQELSNNVIIDIYVPETYYTENITVIAQKNAEITRAYKPAISRFNIEETETEDNGKELKMVSDEVNITNESPIEIYVPENFDKQTSTEDEVSKKSPQPIGGYEKYNEYLKNSLRRPTDDACRDRKGKVAVEFSVNSLGQPFLFDIKYSLCGTSDNEAIRLIQSGPRWTTGTERVIVKVQF